MVLFVAGNLALAWILGERQARADEVPYESGMLPTGDAWGPYSPAFHVVALLWV